MDFPKKQAQRLMPLYLLEYSEKLFENHPDPEAPWGGGGDYTAGYGIDITNSEISVDTDVIATKTDIPTNYVTTNTNQGITGRKWFYDQVYIMGDDEVAISLDPAGIWINQQGAAINQGTSLFIQVERNSGDPMFAWGKAATDIYKTYKLPHTDLPGNYNYVLATTEDIPSLTGYATEQWVQNQGYLTNAALLNYVTTTQLEDALDDYALKTDIPENVSDLNNDAGYTTQTWVENQGYITGITSSDVVAALGYTPGTSNFSGNYNDLTNKPTIPTVNDPTITFTQGGVTKGSITLNQSSNQTIALDAGVSGNLPFLNVEDPNYQMYFSLDGSSGSYYRYVDLSASNRMFYVNLSALNPVFKNGLTSTYNTQTNELEVSIDWNTIPSIHPNVPLSPVQTLSTLQVNGIVYGIPNLITIELTSNSGTLTSAELGYITNSKEKVIIYGRYAGYNYYQAQYQSSTASTATYASEPSNATPVGGNLTNYQVVVTIDTTTGAYTVSSQDTGVALKTNLATVATSGNYNDLSNKPTIPDAVSGTNDGTNWTTLTIGNSTYDIPQDGTAPGMIGEVIFSNTSGSTNLTLTMAHSFADYSYVDIQWINNDGLTNSTRIYEPNGKTVILLSANVISNGYFDKAGIYSLSGTAMTQVSKGQGAMVNNSSSIVDYKDNTQTSDYVKVTKVIGYKANSSALTTETWTFTLQDGTTITKNIVTA